MEQYNALQKIWGAKSFQGGCGGGFFLQSWGIQVFGVGWWSNSYEKIDSRITLGSCTLSFFCGFCWLWFCLHSLEFVQIGLLLGRHMIWDYRPGRHGVGLLMLPLGMVLVSDGVKPNQKRPTAQRVCAWHCRMGGFSWNSTVLRILRLGYLCHEPTHIVVHHVQINAIFDGVKLPTWPLHNKWWMY